MTNNAAFCSPNFSLLQSYPVSSKLSQQFKPGFKQMPGWCGFPYSAHLLSLSRYSSGERNTRLISTFLARSRAPPPKAFVLIIVYLKRMLSGRLWRFMILRSSLKPSWLLLDCSLDLLFSRYNRNGISREWDPFCLVDYGLLFSLDLSCCSFLITGSLHNIVSLTSRIVEVIYSAIGALIFSLYIIYDTYNICNMLHPDEYIIGSISLYVISCPWLILVTLISSIYSWIFLEFWILWIARISWMIKHVEGKYSKWMFGSLSSRNCVAWSFGEVEGDEICSRTFVEIKGTISVLYASIRTLKAIGFHFILRSVQSPIRYLLWTTAERCNTLPSLYLS